MFRRWTVENSAEEASLIPKQMAGLGGSNTMWGAAGNSSGPYPSLLPALEKGLLGCHISLAAAHDPRALTPSPHPSSVLSSLVVPQTVPQMPVPSVTQVCRAVWAMAAGWLPCCQISHCSAKNVPLSSLPARGWGSGAGQRQGQNPSVWSLRHKRATKGGQTGLPAVLQCRLRAREQSKALLPLPCRPPWGHSE